MRKTERFLSALLVAVVASLAAFGVARGSGFTGTIENLALTLAAGNLAGTKAIVFDQNGTGVELGSGLVTPVAGSQALWGNAGGLFPWIGRTMSTTSATAQTFCTATTTSGTGGMLCVTATVVATDNTNWDSCSLRSRVIWVDKAGTITQTTTALDAVGSATTTGTLTMTCQVTTGSHLINLQVTPTWVTIVPTQVTLIYSVETVGSNSSNTATLAPQ